MIETNADAPSTLGAGRWSNFSISGKLVSTCGSPVARRRASSSGRRCRVCGPNTTSTNGARSTMPAPSWLATQPPTAIINPGRARLICFTRPRSANTFSCAFSRTEQVLKTMTSASSARSVASRPSASRSTSAILSESYSFIWQPKVRRNSFPIASPKASSFDRIGLRRFLRRQDPDLSYQALPVELVLHGRAGRNGAWDHEQVRLIADLSAGGKALLRVVDLHDHFLHVAHHAALRVLADGAQLAVGRGGASE